MGGVAHKVSCRFLERNEIMVSVVSIGTSSVSARKGGGGRKSADLDAIRNMGEGMEAVITFDPSNTKPTKDGTPATFDDFVARKRSGLYKTKSKDVFAPTLGFKPEIRTGENCVIVRRPLGSTYVTDAAGNYVVQNGKLVTQGQIVAAS